MPGQLKFNQATGRIELGDYEFHAGDPLKVLIVNGQGRPEWMQTRMEYDHGSKEWYLAGIPDIEVRGLFAEI
jgi:hypothetical protein